MATKEENVARFIEQGLSPEAARTRAEAIKEIRETHAWVADGPRRKAQEALYHLVEAKDRCMELGLATAATEIGSVLRSLPDEARILLGITLP